MEPLVSDKGSDECENWRKSGDLLLKSVSKELADEIEESCGDNSFGKYKDEVTSTR